MNNARTVLLALQVILFKRLATQKVRIKTIAGICVLAISVSAASPLAFAVSYNESIRQLQSENQQNSENKEELQTEAVTLESKIAELQATISGLEASIRSNETKKVELDVRISETELEIARQKVVLGTSVRQMYIENDTSMMEKMASSKNLSDFIEKEEYGLSVQAEIQKTIERIAQLRKQQASQKAQVEQILADNITLQTKVAAEKVEVDRLLAMNKAEQSAYSLQIASNSSKISDLERQQAEENARWLRQQAALVEEARRKAAAQQNNADSAAPAPVAQQAAPAGITAVDGRAYPWAGVGFPNSRSDPWGMYMRQCVSYTAWKVAESGRHMPYWGGRGNAKNWDDNAIAAGIPVSTSPRVGDVAVRNTGTYGHVMYVEDVYNNGTIRISQYNASWTGTYSEATITPAGLNFIHFR